MRDKNPILPFVIPTGALRSAAKRTELGRTCAIPNDGVALVDPRFLDFGASLRDATTEAEGVGTLGMTQVFETAMRNILAFACTALTLVALFSPPIAADTPARLRHDLDAATGRLAELRRDGVRHDGAIVRVQLSNDAALRFEERLRELEREIRSLTSRLEDLAHQQREQARENERFRNDVEFRLSQIEKGGRAAPPVRPGPGPGRPPTRGDDNEGEKPRGADNDASGPGAAKEEYDGAISQLRRSDYKAAEAALSQFLKRHPNDPQAPNAHFWLAETYLALNRPADAALHFADVVKKYPKHPKAQDSLYKLGIAMARQSKKPEACAAFAEYGRRHPNGALKREVDIESRRLACG